jgi:hypothetical protein
MDKRRWKIGDLAAATGGDWEFGDEPARTRPTTRVVRPGLSNRDSQ